MRAPERVVVSPRQRAAVGLAAEEAALDQRGPTREAALMALLEPPGGRLGPFLGHLKSDLMPSWALPGAQGYYVFFSGGPCWGGDEF